MELYTWGARWNVSNAAIEELKNIIGIEIKKTDAPPLSEAAVQNLVRIEASKKGCRLWRNNIGASYMKDGSFLRYGLANESKGMNAQIKSADLIGIRPVKITPSLVGLTIGQFVSREIKAVGWRFTGNEREQAQLRWAELILSLGGDACFAVGEGTL